MAIERGRIAAIILFAGLVASVPILNDRTVTGNVDGGPSRGRPASSSASASAPTRGDARSRYGLKLEEVSKSAGIDFVHVAPKLDPKLDHIMPQVASMGAGVSAVDFDRDGWIDLYVTSSGEGAMNRLYRNRGDGTFEDVAPAMGVADLNREGTGASMGTVWADYDGDGYEDMLLYKWGRPELFRNDGGEGFVRATEEAGLPAWMNVGCATWFDYDRDGRVDLFLGGYWADDLDLWHLDTTKMMPESFEYARNGGGNRLFRNLGDGKFRDVTADVGLDSRRWALCASAADLRGTGFPDLFVANDYGVSELFANDGGKGFREIGRATGVGFSPKSGMNVAFGDVFNDGRFSVYVTNISEEGVLIQGNNLWVPKEGTSGDGLKYENLADALGVELGGWSFGAQFGDMNNDGTQDLVLTNGYVSDARDASYWYDYSIIAGGHGSIIADAKNWPAMKGKSLSGYQQKKVGLNDGAGRFSEVSQAVGYTDLHDGRAVVLADLWNRGALDLVVANQRGPLLIYKNDVDPANGWIGFDLRGRAPNTGAIGAEVRLHWGGRVQLQQVSGGVGYSAQQPRRLHFGLGKDAAVDRAVIRWPSGREQVIEAPEPGRVHTVEES
jgi:hypothetical protein